MTKKPLGEMRLFTLDWETYYDSKTYSLSKMTTESYVNDPRFQAIGVSVKNGEGNTRWADAKHEDLRRMLRADDKEAWANTMLLCHNTMFDALILARRFGIVPGFYLDTLSMARALHPTSRHSLAMLAEKYELGVKGTEVLNANGKRLEDFSDEELARYGEYCCNDTDLTYKLFEKMVDGFPASELALIDITIRMYTQPTLMLDRELVEQELRQEQERKARLIEAVGVDGDILRSNPKFADLLTSLGVDPPTKLSGKQKNPDGTPKRVWAFAKNDADFSALLEHDDPAVVTAMEARMGCKSSQRETRAQRFLGIHERNDGMLPIPLAYYSAHTGRYGGADKINAQNLPRVDSKDETTGLLRKAIIAPEGSSLVVADLSQIEARLLVYQANQFDKLDAFAQKRDVYSEQASVIFGRHVDRKKNKDDFVMGFVGKSTVLGAGFGLGFIKFASSMYAGFLGGSSVTFDDTYVDTLGIEVDDFEKWINNYRRADMLARILEAKPLAMDLDSWMKHNAVAQQIIRTYRASNEKVVEYWGLMNDVLVAMLHGDEMSFGGPDGDMMTTGKNCIWLPNGMRLQYDGLECKAGDWSFLRKKEGRVQRVYTYAGSVVENCIAEGTLVHTSEGWKPIESVSPGDWVSDGNVFVRHGGLIDKGHQFCMEIDGVEMTPDHKVWTVNGWEPAVLASTVMGPISERLVMSSKKYQVGQRRVFDLLDCGPDNRFVVLGNTGPFIVHNCTQALARIVITNGMRKAHSVGLPVALQVHDEIVTVAPDDDAEVAYKWLIKTLRKAPKWAEGLPLDAEGGFGKSYGLIK